MQLALPDRYALLKVLGRGGMGTVVLAHDRRLERPVAVKVIRPDVAGRPTVTERFAREARTMAAVQHPHLIRLLDLDLDHAPPYFVMERIEGRTLAELLGWGVTESEVAVRRCSAAQVVTLGRELGGALAALHAQGILHRDLKPANVMLRAATGAAVLMDLGLVLTEDGTDLTDTGALLGTPHYLPPEVAAGGAWTEAGDQFQLGVLLRLALTGASHVDAGSVEACLRAARAGEWLPFPALEPPADPRLVAVLERAMRPGPASRYPDVAALVRALEDLEDPARPRGPVAMLENSTALPSPPTARPGTLVRGSLALVAGALVASLGLGAAREAAPPPQRAARSPLAGTPRFSEDVAPTVALDVLDPALTWGEDPDRRRLHLSGPARIPLPAAGPPWRLGWQVPGREGTRTLTGRELGAGTARQLLSLDTEDPTELIRAWRPDPQGDQAGPWEDTRQAFQAYLPRLPDLLAGDAPVDLRRRLWDQWQTARRSAAQVRFRGGRPTELRLPRGVPGSYYEGYPDQLGPQHVVVLEPEGPDFRVDRYPGTLMVPADTQGYSEAHGLRFAWPETPRDGRPLTLELRVWILTGAFHLRVRSLDPARPFAAGYHAPPEPLKAHLPLETVTRIRNYSLVVPGDLAPPPGTPLRIDLVDFAGEFRPTVRVEHLHLWWPQ